MAKTIEVTDHDYDVLLLRAGDARKIKHIVTSLIKLSDEAANELSKYDKWRETCIGTGAKPSI